MYTREALLDIHERCHRSFQMMLDHCAGLTEGDRARTLNGFGLSTVREQLHHAIGAEKYWLSVVLGCLDASENESDAASLDALTAFHESVSAATRAYLGSATEEELNSARPMKTWHDPEVMLVPAHVILRTQTHLFQHQGQLTAMCRLLGHPVEPGMDFPLK